MVHLDLSGEMTRNDLHEACQRWDGSEENFRQLLLEYFEVCRTTPPEVAQALGMAGLTVVRWQIGVSRPHPMFQQAIITWIGERCLDEDR